MWMTGRLEAHGNPDLASGGTHCYLGLDVCGIKAEPFYAIDVPHSFYNCYFLCHATMLKILYACR